MATTRIGSLIPENNTKTNGGAVPASAALARSFNLPAVRLLPSFGLERFYDALKDLGLTSLFRLARDYGLTLVLGGAEGTLWDLTGMYAGLARSANRMHGFSAEGGSAFFPTHYLSVVKAPEGKTGTIGPGACWLTLKALLEVERPGEEGA